MAEAAGHAFRQLHDADLKFGFVKDEQGRQVELGNATLSQFQQLASSLFATLSEIRRKR